MATACGCSGPCGCGRPSFVTAAFRSCNENEAYIFLKDKYVVENYFPAESKDKILCGPIKISEGLPCLKGTTFANCGIDCAFATKDAGRVYIFSGNSCALLDYNPCCPKNARIVKGPMLIEQMFPFLKNTVFASGIDAAYELGYDYPNHAHLFKGGTFAGIDYAGSNPRLVGTDTITKVFPCLKGTVFESNIGAAFASHIHNEAYLFKGEYCARMKVTPGSNKSYLMGGVQKMKDLWPELSQHVPRPNMSHN